MTVGKVATSILTDDDGMTKIIYHSTPVVKFNDKRIILNSGGWRTSTTKIRMNQAANQFKLGFSVHQKKYDWFVSFDGDDAIPFFDGMILNRGACPSDQTEPTTGGKGNEDRNGKHL